MLMADMLGVELSDDDKRLLDNEALGGVILFGKNVQTPTQVRHLCDSIYAHRDDIVIGIDQEGGRVRRLREGFTPLPALGQIGAYYTKDPVYARTLAQAVGLVLGAEVAAMGIDMSFAPVLDVNKGSSVIGDRSFGDCVLMVTDLARQMRLGMERSIFACVKHFCGHGAVLADSHHHVAIDERGRGDILADMLPFVAHLDAHAIMPAHVIYHQFDAMPATFSRHWLHDILRTQLGYQGVIISDDLCMQGAIGAPTAHERASLALASGVDLALICHNREETVRALECIKICPQKRTRITKLKRAPIAWAGDVMTTCAPIAGYLDARNLVLAMQAQLAQNQLQTDPTLYC